ncbi:hypothetical protein [Egicoccus halophilus]|uniref:Uncharacterized protein n=1 Tax=Egicoccus halophilus TaxID=1670830 RepID=A0A8J3AAZ5_9ACTN|nr:hypothetical protein [Egicoccus halophilus]GGI06931.1 hypothetical protein GCM10011354_21560 [Egicoccus halophilus]
MPSTSSLGKLALAATGGALAARGLQRLPQARFAGMSGTSIAAPGAAGWVTDFLNAAYFRRDADQRSTADLRLAFGILTTRWHRAGARRLRAADVAPFHKAFGRDRFVDDADSPRGTLNTRQLREGAARLLGDWFLGAWDDPTRRAYGIAFPEVADREAYLPELRLDHAKLGGITPPQSPAAEQTWHTYPPVLLGDEAAAGRALELLTQPQTWPDYGSSLGRFTPVRSGGLDGQTFEIEVLGEPVGPIPVLLRAYVTVTELLTAGDALDGYTARLNETFARYAPFDPDPLPEGAAPAALIELTTHAGHFLGRARNRLLVFTADGQAWVRAVGNWDPLDWHLDRLYAGMGRYCQHAFWGMGQAHESVLHQLADAVRSDLGGRR